MNLQRVVSAGALGVAALLYGTAAQAVTWAFSYSGTGVTASGTFTTAGAALTPESILSIAGQRNGFAITGLVPLGTDPDFLYDNEFTIAAPNFTDGGVLFSLVGGRPNTNVYFFEGGYFDLFISDGGPVETPITWAVAVVPEPATVLTMLAGLGLLGACMRKARANA